MTTESISTEHIAITPGTCSGRPRIVGTRIRVQNIVTWHEQLGMSPEEIVSTYPHLTLADVYAALAYYHDHQEEIRAHFQEDDELIAALKAQQPSIIEKLRARIDAASQSDPVSHGRELPSESGPRSSSHRN